MESFSATLALACLLKLKKIRIHLQNHPGHHDPLICRYYVSENIHIFILQKNI